MSKKGEPKSGLARMGIAVVIGIAIAFFNNLVCKEIHGKYFDPYCPYKYYTYIIPGLIFVWGMYVQYINTRPIDTSK